MATRHLLGELYRSLMERHQVSGRSVSLNGGVTDKILEGLIGVDSDLTVPVNHLSHLFTLVNVHASQILIPANTTVWFQRPTFAQMLRRLRTDRKLTQKELAEKAGVAQSTLVQYETGRRVPSYPTVVKLARALAVKIDTFEDAMFVDEPPPEAVWWAPLHPTVEEHDPEETDRFDKSKPDDGLDRDESGDPIPF